MKIQVGKSYINSNGSLRHIVAKVFEDALAVFRDSLGDQYTEAGECFSVDGAGADLAHDSGRRFTAAELDGAT